MTQQNTDESGAAGWAEVPMRRVPGPERALVDALTADLEAVLDGRARDAETAAFEADTPHTVKRGVERGKALKIKADFQSTPLSENGPKTGRRSRRTRTPPDLQAVLDRFVFDWFQGVIPNTKGGGDCVVGGPEEAHGIARAVRFLEKHGLRAGEPSTGGRGYATGLPWFEGNGVERVASLASGSHSGGMPNLTVSGGRGLCAVLAPHIQAEFPGLRLTRADAALDLVDPDAFEALLSMSKRFTKGRDMSPPRVFGAETPEDGRTFYIGAKSAEVMLRVYEKGRQLNAASRRSAKRAPSSAPAPAAEADPGWVRIEFAFSGIPGRKKAAFSMLKPGEMVAAYAWPRLWLGMAAAEVGLTAKVEKAARVLVETEDRVKDLDSTMRWGAEQYGKAFARAAVMELKRERAEAEAAGAAPVEITGEAIRDRAASLFAWRVLQTDKVERVVEVDLAGDEMTPEARAALIADRQQALHGAGVGARARALNRLRLAVAPATRNPETVETLEAAAAEAAERAAGLAADKEAIAAEWAVRERQAEAEARRSRIEVVAA